jgi:hypothetical protein
MRATEFITEAPLQDYVPLGDFEKKGQFNPVDRKLITHPVTQTKAIKFLENTPYNFRLFFNNSPGLRKFKEYGAINPNEVKNIFSKEQADLIVNRHENAITIVFIGNTGDRAVMMTPWVMAHRFGHAITASNRNNYGTSRGNIADPWNKAESYFFNYINKILKDYYNKSAEHRYTNTAVNWNLQQEYGAFFNAIGTQRSSRTGQIKRPYEFMYELFAQYLKDGRITLNPLPVSLDYGRKAWGRTTKFMRLNPELQNDELLRGEASLELSNVLSNLFDSVLRASVGKIYIM